jgi:hypothetical protein
MPGAAIPSTQKGNDIRADVILAEEFEGQIGRWRAFMTERVDALFPRYHRPLIILHSVGGHTALGAIITEGTTSSSVSAPATEASFATSTPR